MPACYCGINFQHRGSRRMRAADLMTSFVVTVRPDATIEYAAQLMLQYRISGLPVTDSEGTVLGIVTESDLLRRAETGTEKRHVRWVSFFIGPGRLAQEYIHSRGRKVSDVMTERVFSVTPEMPLADLVVLMETKHVKRVPVVDQGTPCRYCQPSRCDGLPCGSALGRARRCRNRCGDRQPDPRRDRSPALGT